MKLFLIVVLEVGQEFLSERTVACAWSGHSERATLPSWVSTVGGFSDEDIDQLGRWRTRTSRRYIRNTQGLIHRMQSCVAQAYRNRAPGVDPFSEEDIITGIRAFERLHRLAPSAVDPIIREIQAPPRCCPTLHHLHCLLLLLLLLLRLLRLRSTPRASRSRTTCLRMSSTLRASLTTHPVRRPIALGASCAGFVSLQPNPCL